MSTNWEHAPPKDEALKSRNQQSEPTRSADSFEDELEKSHSDSTDALGLHGDGSSQTFTNADVDDILQIPDWPGPQTLEITRRESILRRLGYALALVPPIIFLGLVLSAIGLHSHETNRFGELVSQACLLGPTVFPIAFSAIMGWCLKTYGRYKSEKGVKLGHLERVIGSQTVFSFLKFAFAFKQLDRLCIVLGILWILSPLGGQGILRMLSMRQLTETSSETAFYLDLYGESDYGPGAYMRNLPNALYVSSIYAPVEVKNRTTDLWGGIKIPSLESLEFDHKDDDWAVVRNVSTYTSLLGIPVNSTALKTAAKYAFTLNATAFNTQCGEPELFNIDPDDRKEQLDSAMFALKTPFVDATNERNISLVTYLRAARVRVMHNCTITPNFLLAKVECDSGHCRVSRIKKLADQDGQQTRAMLNRKTWYKIARELPKSTDDQFNGYGSQTERYLYDPQALYPNNHDVDLRNVSVADLSSRFTTIINTYYHATISPSLRLNSLVPSELYFSPHNPPKTAEAIVHALSPKTYNRRWEWVLSAFVASLALLGVTITGIVYDRRVVCPDIYGYVSSMTRDNPYFPLPPTGCTLEGTDRAVLLKDVVVRFEDVAPNRKIGHLALTMAGYKKPTEQHADCRLRRTKMYSGCSCMQ